MLREELLFALNTRPHEILRKAYTIKVLELQTLVFDHRNRIDATLVRALVKKNREAKAARRTELTKERKRLAVQAAMNRNALADKDVLRLDAIVPGGLD
jgi:hypothetical protein